MRALSRKVELAQGESSQSSRWHLRRMQILRKRTSLGLIVDALVCELWVLERAVYRRPVATQDFEELIPVRRCGISKILYVTAMGRTELMDRVDPLMLPII